MTQTSGSAILQATPEATPAAGMDTPAPADNTPPEGAQPAAPANDGKWFDTFQNQELKGLAQNKGWESPEALADSYRNLEKLVGQDTLRLPKDEADAEGWGKIYAKLGRPETAEGYKLPLPEGDSGEFAKVASGWFHEAGLSQKQAEALGGKWNSFQSEMQKQADEAFSVQADQDVDALRREYGGAYDERMQAGREYVRELGLKDAELNAIERAVGTKRMLSMFAEAGLKLGEAKAPGLENSKAGGFGSMTPAQGIARKAELMNDKEWVTKYLNGDSTARAEMEKVSKAIASGTQQ